MIALGTQRFGCARTSHTPLSHQRHGGTSWRARASSTNSAEGQGAGGTPDAPWAQPGYLGAVVSQLPGDKQQAAVAAIAGGIAAGTLLTAGVLGPAVSAHLPGFLQVTSKSWFPLGPIFVAAGVAHFTEEQGFINMMPHRGAWGGLWQLPGSASFHVRWTGVAEILGGAGLCLGCLPFDAVPDELSRASAMALFFLTAVVTPANTYMYTHNAPGPVPESVAPGPLPWQGHAARGVMQCLLLAALWGIATGSS